MQRRLAEAFDGPMAHRFLLGIRIVADVHHRYRGMACDQVLQDGDSGGAVGIQHPVHKDERVGVGSEQLLGFGPRMCAING